MFRLKLNLLALIILTLSPSILWAAEKNVEVVDVTHADSIRVECPGVEPAEVKVRGVDEIELPSSDCEWSVLKKAPDLVGEPDPQPPQPKNSGLRWSGGFLLSPVGFISNGDTQAVGITGGGYLTISPPTSDFWGLRLELESGYSRNTGVEKNQWAFRTFFGPEFRFGSSDVLSVGFVGEVHTKPETKDTLTGFGGAVRFYHFFDADWGGASPFMGVRGSLQSQHYAPVWPPSEDNPPRRGAAWSIGPVLGVGFR